MEAAATVSVGVRRDANWKGERAGEIGQFSHSVESARAVCEGFGFHAEPLQHGDE